MALRSADLPDSGAAPARDVVEASMSSLMLCLLPCLAVAGWAFAELYVKSRRSLVDAMRLTDSLSVP
jgi:hypothetical protein